jgi:tetratricopeptide (TPR) repeat protein
MRLYEAAVANKRMEAQNALLFAGRVAVLEKRPMAAAASFRKARALKDDPDARLLIGQHLAALSDTNGALNEYRAALAHPSINEKPGTAAELHRSVAQVLIQRNARGTARTELEHAKSLDANLSDYLGLGKTHELIGDLYAPRTHNRNAAETAYHVAIENFVRADDASSARRVRHKLSSLTGMPTIQKDDGITRMLDKCGHYLLKLVDKLRSQAQRRQD